MKRGWGWKETLLEPPLALKPGLKAGNEKGRRFKGGMGRSLIEAQLEPLPAPKPGLKAGNEDREGNLKVGGKKSK